MPAKTSGPLPTAIWWVRRDLRLSDNPALSAAAAYGAIVPVFVFDPAILNSPYVGPKRTAFLFEGLRDLDDRLRQRGSRLIVRRGSPVQELASLAEEVDAQVICATADHSPYARERDAEVAESLPVQYLDGPTFRHPDDVLKVDGHPYTVFGSYSRSWQALPLDVRARASAPQRLHTPTAPGSAEIPATARGGDAKLFPAGEGWARSRLRDFTSGEGAAIADYAESRDRLDLPATARLSPYFRLGMLSVREAVRLGTEARQNAPTPGARKGAEVWLDELVWREFFTSILYHLPHTLTESFRDYTRRIAWINDEQEFAAWCGGRTGYPVVDAAMRQLAAEGWIHGRARMIAASFLVKDLLVDWRWGERFFRHHLLDGDPAANVGNWQWAAGTGTDAAPYFRVFNPILQGRKHDPRGAWVRRWVPELSRVPDGYVHQPWEMDLDDQRRAGCIVGRDYPMPIISHGFARERALAAYRAARAAEDN